MTTRVSERLWQRLRAMGLADQCGASLRPLRPSRASRANGAWSWAAFDADGIPLPLGAHRPMAELLEAERLVASRYPGDVDVDVDVWRGPVPAHVRVGEWSHTEIGQVLLEASCPAEIQE